MDNLINSLVNNSVGKLTNQLIIDGLKANPNMSGEQLAKTLGVSMKEIASALSEDVQKSGFQTTTVGNTETGQDVTNLRDLGAGFNAYQDENGQTSGFSRVDPSRPGMIQLYGANGEYIGQQKITSTTQDMLKTLGPIALAAGGSMLAQGFLGNAASTGAGSAFEAMNAGAGAFEGGTALNSLATMTPAELAKFEALNAGATAMSDLGASELANAGASANTVGGTTIPNAVNTAAGLTAADALKAGLTTAGLANVAGTVVNQGAISNARDLISQGSTTAADVLSNAYKDQQGYYTGNRTDLGNIYKNTNASLNNIIGNQVGIYGNTNQVLSDNYANTQADLARVYNQQVGFHKPYQAVGRAGSEGLIANKDYFNKQFGTADLNTELAPNYAFQLGQGQMANQRAANMGGGSIGGNALQGLQKYTQDYAGNAYQQAFNNFQNQRQNIYNNFSGMANIGLTSAGQLASLGNTYGSNLGALSSNYGSNRVANAGQLQGAYNQYGSNLTNAANQYGSNLTTGTGQMLNAGSLYGANRANLAVGTASALANNQIAGGVNTASGFNNLANLALLGSVIKPT